MDTVSDDLNPVVGLCLSGKNIDHTRLPDFNSQPPTGWWVMGKKVRNWAQGRGAERLIIC